MLTRTPQGLYATGQLRGTIRAECVLCLVEVDVPLASQLAELFYYPPETAPAGELTVSDDVHLDLAPLIREDMWLAQPIRVLCRPDCQGLCPQCGQNLNDQPCQCVKDESDPRWAALNKLKEAS